MKQLIILCLLTVFCSFGCARRVVVQKPPPRVEIIPLSPSPRHAWVKGHYVKRGRNFVWVGGHYTVGRRRYVARY